MKLFKKLKEKQNEENPNEENLNKIIENNSDIDFQEGCVVWTRDQLVEYLYKTVDFDDIGKVTDHVQKVMLLQNDISRPTYVIEVNDDLSSSDIGVLASAFREAGVSCVLVPTNTVKIVAQVTHDSMDIKGGGAYANIMHSAQNAAVAAETIEREMSKEE